METERTRFASGFFQALSLLAMVGCGPLLATSEQTTDLPAQSTATLPMAAQTPVSATPISNLFPLSDPGPYFVSSREYKIVDESRNGREIGLVIQYPAVAQTDNIGRALTQGAIPDMSGAPYPVILTSPNSGNVIFRSHLASHGFVMVIVEYPSLYDIDYWDLQTIDHPRDIIFVLDWMAANSPDGLKDVIDTDHAGVAGYSSDGDKALVLSGARIDPGSYLTKCSGAPEVQSAAIGQWVRWVCSLAARWDEFVADAGEGITKSNDGLWQPLTDKRIRAVMPMGAGGAWLFGERGLAAVDRPTFIIAGTQDTIVPYSSESAYIFQNIGTREKYMVSFVGQGHLLVFNSRQTARINHFATAFFGYYLGGKSEYRSYFSEDFVSQFDDLAWGVFEEQ